MYEAEQLSGLIGKIYDSALDPALWAEALPQVARFVGGPSAGVWSEDVASKSANVIAVSGFDAGYVKAYVTQYANFDPSPSAFCLAKVGEPFARSRIAPDDEFFRTRYFREWVRPQGLADCVYVVLDKCGPSTTLFAVSRRKHDGPVDEHMHHRVRVIAPHLRRAALIGRAIDLE